MTQALLEESLASTDTLVRQEAIVWLARQGEALADWVPALIQTRTRIASYAVLSGTIAALERAQHPLAEEFLMDIWEESLHYSFLRNEVRAALQALLPSLPDTDPEAVLTLCVRVVGALAQERPEVACAAMERAVQLAQTQPSGAYRALLNRKTSNRELQRLQKKLKVLLANWKDLPVVADAPPKEAQNLPLPSQEHS